MPTNETRLTIYNGVIDVLLDTPLVSDDQDNAIGRWLRRQFERHVYAALRANLWAFAVESHVLDADGDHTNTQRWAYRYTMPNGALRMISPTLYGKRGYPPVAFEIKSNKIYTDQPPPFYVDFVMVRLEPGQWDPLFAQVIIGSLAEAAAHKLTRKATFVTEARRIKLEALEAAEQINAYESGIEEAAVHDIILAREL